MQGCSIQEFRFCFAVSEGIPLQSLDWLLMSGNEEARHKPVGNKHTPFYVCDGTHLPFFHPLRNKPKKSSRKLQMPESLKCIWKIMRSITKLNSFCYSACRKLLQSKHKERGSTQVLKHISFFQWWVQMISKNKLLTNFFLRLSPH